MYHNLSQKSYHRERKFFVGIASLGKILAQRRELLYNGGKSEVRKNGQGI